MKNTTLNTPLVSIIIPAFNQGKFLDDCLSSVAGQSYSNLEIVIINDGSTDGTEILCKKFAAIDSRIVYIKQKNQGLSAARNRGITAAHGDYIFFLDGDDVLAKNAIELLLGAARSTKTEIITGNFFRFTNNPQTKRISTECNPAILSTEESFRQILTLKKSTYVCGVLFSSRCVNRIEFPLNRYYEDLSTLYKFYSRTDRIAFLKLPLYGYRQNISSITNTLTAKKINDHKIAGHEMLNFINNKYPDLSLEIALYKKCLYAELIVSSLSVGDDTLKRDLLNLFNSSEPRTITSTSYPLCIRTKIFLLAYMPRFAIKLLTAKSSFKRKALSK